MGRKGAARPLLEADNLFVGAKETGSRLTYWDGSGRTLAVVNEVSRDGDASFDVKDVVLSELARKAVEAWAIDDAHGPVFLVDRYEATDHPSYDVLAPGGAPLATFLCQGGLLHEHVVVRDDATAPVATIRTRHHLHELRELHGQRLATCRRVVDPAGNDTDDEVWGVEITDAAAPLDRRALVAAPLVCHLMEHPKRHIDPDCMVSTALLVAVPPVGAVLIGVERAIDGLHWLQRKLD